MRFFFLISLLCLITLRTEAQQIYDFRLETPEGKPVSYDQIRGQLLTVIDFWATWCKPCVSSIPKLVELSGTYDSNVVSFVGISIDSPRNLSKIKPFTETMGIPYPILLDTDQQLMHELNVTVIPTLLVADADGEIVYIHEGYAPGDDKLIKEEIDRIIHEGR